MISEHLRFGKLLFAAVVFAKVRLFAFVNNLELNMKKTKNDECCPILILLMAHDDHDDLI
jgi:hypothetical protein